MIKLKNFHPLTVRIRLTCFCCIVFFILFPTVQPLSAQNLTQASYSKAKAVLEASLRAYGGLENLRSVKNFSVTIDGFQYHRNQSLRPDRTDSTARGYEATIDLANSRYSMVLQRGGVGRDLIAYQDIFDGNERIVFNPANKTKNTRPVAPNWKQQYAALFLPPHLLLNAYGRLPQLRYVGKATVNNREQNVIGFAGADGALVTLYIDAITKWITKQDMLGSDDFLGDAVTETFFSDYRPTTKFVMPFLVITKTAGEMTTTLRYKKISFDQDLDEAQFQLAVAATTQPASTPPDTKVSALGENIYLVGAGGYRVLFVNFKEYIWVMEAPAGEASREVIKKIKATIPGKPIKYLAVTHFHIDHSGGLRSYVAEGASIITTKGNRTYFEQLANNNFTISPDSLSTRPQKPTMEFIVNKKRVFTDGTTTVELYDIGPSPHAEEMLIAYLPKEKIVFEADLFDFLFDDRTPTTAHFAKWMAEKRLDVEKIIPVHGTITTMKDFLATTAAAQSNVLYKNLPVGRHEVGFQIISITDSTRVTKGELNYLGEKVEGNRYRQFTVHLWYPATSEKGKTKLRLADYAYNNLFATTNAALSESAKATRIETLRSSIERWFGKPGDTTWKNFLQLPMLATADAQPLTQKFPLLIGMLRPFSTALTNEVLASNGYVVAMVVSPDFTSFANAALSQVPDMQLTVRHLHNRFDGSNIGVYGFSGSGFIPVLFSMFDQRVKALADIESGIYMTDLHKSLSASNYYVPSKLRASFLHIFSRDLSKQETHLDELETKTKFAKRHRLLLNQPSLHHWDFATEGYASAAVLNLRGMQQGNIKKSFEIANLYLLHFFDSELKGVEASRKFLSAKPALPGTADSLWDITTLHALQPAPAAEELEEIIRKSGVEEALSIVKATLPNDSSTNLLQPFTLNRLGYSFLGEKKYREAVGVFSLNTELHPNDPNLFDSLSEAYELAGDQENCKKAAQQVINLLAKKATLNSREEFLKAHAVKRVGLK